MTLIVFSCMCSWGEGIHIRIKEKKNTWEWLSSETKVSSYMSANCQYLFQWHSRKQWGILMISIQTTSWHQSLQVLVNKGFEKSISARSFLNYRCITTNQVHGERKVVWKYSRLALLMEGTLEHPIPIYTLPIKVLREKDERLEGKEFLLSK